MLIEEKYGAIFVFASVGMAKKFEIFMEVENSGIWHFVRSQLRKVVA